MLSEELKDGRGRRLTESTDYSRPVHKHPRGKSSRTSIKALEDNRSISAKASPFRYFYDWCQR